ncbi:hypothetical protein GCM10017786_35280 [Amycolatopsis deserti]|uniref:Uncharacterized protein n=1 Tax=Amycolatopsis deserti TaxID=185696 RepID=A0ABQ3J551_9PSEU|nr:hypothetical protein GCM10017786_35280 [Amycolatopsis deserti]
MIGPLSAGGNGCRVAAVAGLHAARRHQRDRRGSTTPSSPAAARSPRSAELNLGHAGFVIVGLFVLTWVIAWLVWHFGRIEERWVTPGTGRGYSSGHD